MTRFLLSLPVIIMLSTAFMYGQERQSFVMHWRIAATVPPSPGQHIALGFAGPVAGVHNDAMIVAGGANFPDGMPWDGGKKRYYDDVLVYKMAGEKLTQQKKTFKLPSAIAYAANCSVENGIVYAGGENENGISNKVILLQWNEATENLVIKYFPGLPQALTNASAAVYDNIIYVAGGETSTAASDRLYSLDLNNLAAGWQALPPLPVPVSHAVLTIQSNGGYPFLYLVGGRKKNATGISDLYASVYAYDIEQQLWNTKKSLPYPLAAGTGIAVDSNHILLFGGDKAETFHQVETVLSGISAERDEAKKQELIRQKNQLLISHPGFSKEVLLYNIVSDEWEVTGTIPFDAPVTTTAVTWNNEVMIPCGEIKAGVRTPGILAVKIEGK
ncbi:MAG TPA: hypothetical protein VFV68_10690 [Agriterribacter sp.]|nr:hypothetical protein [Agriterribacter sp.]